MHRRPTTRLIDFRLSQWESEGVGKKEVWGIVGSAGLRRAPGGMWAWRAPRCRQDDNDDNDDIDHSQGDHDDLNRGR